MIVTLGAVIGAIFSALQIFSKWREERRQETKLARKMGRAEKRIAFLDTWRKTQSTVNVPERQKHIDQYVARELDILMVETLYTHQDSNSILESSRRWLLLFLPRSFWGWGARFGFFLTFPICLIYLILGMSLIADKATRNETDRPLALTLLEEEPATVQESQPDLNKMTIQEYAHYVSEQNPEAFENGVVAASNIPVQNNMSAEQLAEEEENMLIGSIALFVFMGSIAFFCYLLSVFDGRERKVENTSERDPLPSFLQYLEHEIEIVEEEELDYRAA